MEAFIDKVSVFGGSYLGDELTSLVTLRNENADQLRKMKIQYIESALAFALVFLSQTDAGKKSGKDPEQLKKIVQEQFVSVASTDGLEEGMIQQDLFTAATQFRT